MASAPIPVGMSEIKTSKKQGDLLSAMGLGSCIGVCVYDVANGVAGLAHVMLPDSTSGRHRDSIVDGKFADTAVPALLESVQKMGADLSKLRAAIAGGAQVFNFSSNSPVLDIGRRNTEAVKTALGKAGVRLVAEETGGGTGRTVTLEVGTGVVRVRSVGGEQRDLTNLGR